MLGTSLPRLLLTSAVYVAGFVGIGVPVASAAVQDRIGTVSTSNPAEVPNSVNPRVKLATDLGPAAADTKLVGMSLRFSMTADQAAALDQLLADQQNSSSPRYHQWLTPTQFAARFGLGSSDIAKVTAWLAGEGFTVTGVANGGTFVTFDGTVAQAEAAFGTSIHNFSVNGEAHFANTTNVSVPSAFANVVGAVTGLHDFRPKPRVHTSVASPRFTSSISEDHFVAPGDIYAIYQVSSTLLSAGGAGIGTARTGCTVVAPLTQCADIAVTGQVDIYLADIAAFRSASGLSATNLPTVVVEGADPGPACTLADQNNCYPYPNESDLAESSIDLEWSGAMAQSATILFVNGVDVMNNSMTEAIDKDLAPIITTSYGNCEAAWGSTEINTLNQLFKQANAQGQTVLAASADTGAADCDAGPLAEEGVAVDFPGSSPYVTSMGGTQFNDGAATGVTQYWNANSSSGTANAGSATGYIPESPWNDFPSILGFSGGGGGFSNFFTKPAWQQGTGVTDGARDVPDLSLDASDYHDTFLYCVDVAAANGAQSCTSGFRNSSTDLETAGGTSFDSQIFGGMLALIEQKNGLHGVGNANPTIYALANDAAYYSRGQTITTLPTVVFNDVTTGNNQLPCVANSANCLVGGVIGYSAGSGYDLASGWGSPNVANLANAWTTVTPLSSGSLGPNISSTNLIASTTIATASPTNSPTVTLTATVTGFTITSAPLATLTTVAGPTPTGTVQFLVNNAPVGGLVTLSPSGVATYTYNTSCSTLGQQNITVSYSGDVTYAGSVGPALTTGAASSTNNGSSQTSPLIVTVAAGTCPSFTLSPSISVPVAAGGTIPVETITLTPVNGFTGTVNFAAYATSSTNANGYVPTLTLSNSSVNVTANSTASTQLTFSGIQADLRMPNAPGHVDSGAMLAQQNSGRVPWKLAGSGVTIASLLLLTLPRRRRLGSLLLVALSVALVGGASGCGSSQAAPPTTTTNSNPYAGIYVVTVVGTYTVSPSQVIQQSSTITYSIN
jgi:subtilase family serine protease